MSLPPTEEMLAEVQSFERHAVLVTAAAEVQADMGVPEAWIEMLRRQSAGDKSWMELWKPFQDLLPEVHDFLQHKVRGVCLLLNEPQPPRLLYVFTQEGDLYFYRGWPPLGDRVPEGKEKVWACLLPGLQQFYREVHDGWTELASDAMGPLPVKDIGYLSDQDWKLTPEELAGLPFRLSDVITVFGNGSGDLLGLDLTHGVRASEDHALAWWHEEPLEPDLNMNFWGLLGGWIGGQMEDVDFAMYTTAEVAEAVRHHPERLRKITRESVLSLPVPTGRPGQEQLAFFWYPAGGPANKQVVRAPTFRVTASLNRLDDIQFLPIALEDTRLGAAPATPLGDLRVGGPVGPGELRPLQAELYRTLDSVLDLALAAAPVPEADKAAVAHLSALYHRLSVIVLLPAYRALNPAFFAWLEQNAV